MTKASVNDKYVNSRPDVINIMVQALRWGPLARAGLGASKSSEALWFRMWFGTIAWTWREVIRWSCSPKPSLTKPPFPTLLLGSFFVRADRQHIPFFFSFIFLEVDWLSLSWLLLTDCSWAGCCLTGCLWAGCSWLLVSELPAVDWLSWAGCCWQVVCELPAVDCFSLSCLLLTGCPWAGCCWLLVSELAAVEWLSLSWLLLTVGC